VKSKNLYNEINSILVSWNPIGVVGPAVQDEYKKYVPKIMQMRNTRDGLLEYLRTLVLELGLSIDNSPEQQEELTHVVDSIINAS
jgi:hypothetical protein